MQTLVYTGLYIFNVTPNLTEVDEVEEDFKYKSKFPGAILNVMQEQGSL